jgi:peptidoglycan/LPS O-acetylase OafA/YrhL
MPGVVWRLSAMGTTGVQIFFCISGYVICSGMMRESKKFGSVSLRGFYRRRAYRILPPLFVYILTVAALTSLGVFKVPAIQFAQASAFLCNIKPLGICGWTLGHTWSLAYEEQFYLVFPVIFSALALMKHQSRLGGIILALGAGCLIAYFASAPFTSTYLGHFLCMLSGCGCAMYWAQIEPFLKKLPMMGWALAVVLIPSLSLFVPPPAIQFGLYPIVMPMLICIAVLGTPIQRPAVRRIFTNPKLVYLGQISYSVYLWQQLATADYGFSSPLPALIMVLGVLVLAHFSYQYFELPMIKYGSAQRALTPIASTHRK